MAIGEWITSGKEKISFRDIILKHIDKILEITRIEFRGGYTEEKMINGIKELIYVPDSRKQYIQSIESLSDLLLPFFKTKDKFNMQKEYDNIIKEIEKAREEFEKTKKGIGSEEHNDYIIKKLRLMRKMFQKLNFLLKEIDYLKGEVYGEYGEKEE